MSSPRIAPLEQYAHVPVLALISLCLMLQSLSTDMYTASFPGLANAFSVSAATVQLTLSTFVIGYGIAQFIMGPLSDRFGRRPVLHCGLAAYALASLVCTFAPSMAVLVAARFFQALGCSAVIIIGRATIRDAYATEHAMQITARASTWLSFTPILSPILGAYLEAFFGWKGSFAFHSCFSLVLLLVVFFRLPETNRYKDPDATDVRGLIRNYRHVMASREFWAYAILGALSYGAIFAFISGISMVLINVLKMPVTWFGYCFAFGTCGFLLGTIFCRQMLRRLGIGRTLRFSSRFFIFFGTVFIVLVFSGLWHWSILVAVMFITMFQHGIHSPMSHAGVITPFPEQAGTAAGLSGVLAMLAALFVGTIVGMTYNGTLYPIAVITFANSLMLFVCARIFPELRAPRVAAS